MKGKEPIRDLALVAALAVGLLAGLGASRLGGSPASIAREPATARRDAPPSPTEASDREMVLAVVREHRPSGSERWSLQLARAIHDEARSAGIDPLLVVSIVAKESSFRSQVVSSAGAVGLMQIRPFVGQDLAASHDLPWNDGEILQDPTINVRLGITYYKQLLQRFGGDANMALTAYNFGPTRVSLAIDQGTYRSSRYAREVLDLYGRLVAARQSLAVNRVVSLPAGDPA